MGELTYLSLFSGIGGMDLGLDRAGMRCVGQVEIDPFCRKVLAKHWPDVPKFEDVKTFSAGMLSETPALIAGGFPCQDISIAGLGAGIDGERSGLWSEFYRLICEVRPRFALVENVTALLVRGLGRLLGDLAAIGFDAEWDCFPASAFGAAHERDRCFVLAYPHSVDGQTRLGLLADHKGTIQQARDRYRSSIWLASSRPPPRVDDGSRAWVDRCKRTEAIGNAVVPQVAEWIGRRIIEAEATHV